MAWVHTNRCRTVGRARSVQDYLFFLKLVTAYLVFLPENHWGTAQLVLSTKHQWGSAQLVLYCTNC
jgi:hypothetical protein